MPGLDRTIDPLSGDYVDATGGEYEETLTIATGVFHQVRGEKNRWCGDANAGSDLYLTKQKGTGPAGQRFADNAIRSALQVFVDSGEAADLKVEAEGRANGRIVMAASITDIQQGPLELSSPLGEV